MDERQRALQGVRRVVVKIGSRLLAEDPTARVGVLADEVARLRERGIEALVVTSGAIALGMRRLGLAERPKELPQLQAAAAVGQGHLIQLYDQALSSHGLVCAQVLLTHDDVRHRGRYLAARHALAAMLAAGAVPVINENDTVSADEIKFGDNDRLAALITSLVEADALVILTDVDGLYDGDPKSGAHLLPLVRSIEEEAIPVAGGTGSRFGTGGMLSKVLAAQIASRFGVLTIVTSGRRERPVTGALDEDRGTLFLPRQGRLASRKHWIAYALKPAGKLVVDEGARRALCKDHKSLLPAGVRSVEGEFGSGEPLDICGPDGAAFARGLCSYDADALRRIAGQKTQDIESCLGYKFTDEVVHRDDLVIL